MRKLANLGCQLLEADVPHGASAHDRQAHAVLQSNGPAAFMKPLPDGGGRRVLGLAKGVKSVKSVLRR